MSLVINGELLKAARIRRGVSIASWASELMVSETQLRSLEEGTDRGFYNQNHRAQIAQKYAAVLGVDLASLHRAPPPRHAQSNASMQRPRQAESSPTAVVSELPVWKAHDVSVALANAHEGAGGRLARPKHQSRQARSEYWIAAMVLAGLAAWFSMDAWQHHRAAQKSDPLTVVEQRLDDPPSALNARSVELARSNKTELALAKPSEPEYPQPFVSKSGAQDQASTSSTSASARAEPKASQVRNDDASAALQASKQARVNDSIKSKAQDSTTPPQQEKVVSPGREMRYPDRLPPANDKAQAHQSAPQPGSGLIAAAPASGMELRNVDLCEVSDQMASVVVPVSRLKNTPYVHVASGVSQRVCVRSADGRVERMNLSANEARSIFGKAPFTVVTEQPSSVEIFYLGARVRHNGESRVLKIVDPDPIS